ncbi:hypothetical protein SAMN05421548_1462 [Paraburkholderia lycopersici]|uniref:Uncharacterized protein n=1 Tax=Paraburkholderia lycopersici TaxID=416944 RepID=A0A1G7CJP7_9BURK|nr:hypothetical protein SAMN05421548_1462 [Paraburkholderia lycopersici]
MSAEGNSSRPPLRRTESHTEVQLNRLPHVRHLNRPSDGTYGPLAGHSGQRFIVGPA